MNITAEETWANLNPYITIEDLSNIQLGDILVLRLGKPNERYHIVCETNKTIKNRIRSHKSSGLSNYVRTFYDDKKEITIMTYKREFECELPLAPWIGGPAIELVNRNSTYYKIHFENILRKIKIFRTMNQKLSQLAGTTEKRIQLLLDYEREQA